MTIDLTFILILVATIVTGLLAGISFDKSLVQLPARHRLGVVAFAAFSRANDLSNGLILYAALGIGAALFNVLAALAALLQGIPFGHASPLYIAALLALLHSFTTTRAAPNMFSLRQPTNDEAQLTETFNRFAKWHNVRAFLQFLNFVALIWALVTYIRAVP
jgi:hypothetical protein